MWLSKIFELVTRTEQFYLLIINNYESHLIWQFIYFITCKNITFTYFFLHFLFLLIF